MNWISLRKNIYTYPGLGPTDALGALTEKCFLVGCVRQVHVSANEGSRVEAVLEQAKIR
ncbi:MAG: hypothetical protein Tsb0018_11690 [Opitutales bacterium]